LSATQADEPRLILASASPRRQDILRALGATFEVRPADIDESRKAGESPAAMVRRLAAAKARAVGVEGIVLAADTAVVLDDEVFGKPTGEAEALAMLARLSGRSHQVYTAVALRQSGKVTGTLSRTEVRFRLLAPGEAERYWATGEPAGKAGAYAIQGYGGLFVATIMGSYSGVVGLPVFETAGLLRDAGIDLLPPAKSPA
jgi:septum formation protein